MPQALLVTLILLPAVLAFLLKSNAAVSFLALCGGFTLFTLSGSEIEQLVGQTKITSLTSNNVDLALLAIPLVITLIFTARSITSKKRRFLEIVPALCAGGLLAVVAAPMFSDALSVNFSDLQVWKQLHAAQTYIVATGLVASLLLIWTSGFNHKGQHKKHHK